MALHPDTFPHVFEEIIECLYDDEDVNALLSFRVVSKHLRELVDKSLAQHMVVSHGRVTTYLGCVWRSDWEEGCRYTKRVDVWEYYPRPIGFESVAPSYRSETSEDMSDIEWEIDGYSPAPMLPDEYETAAESPEPMVPVDQPMHIETQLGGNDESPDDVNPPDAFPIDWQALLPPPRRFFSPEPKMDLLEVAEASRMWAANTFMQGTKPKIVRCLGGQVYDMHRKPLDMLSISLVDIAEEQPFIGSELRTLPINPKCRRNVLAATYHEGYGLQARTGFTFNEERMDDHDELEVTFLYAIDPTEDIPVGWVRVDGDAPLNWLMMNVLRVLTANPNAKFRLAGAEKWERGWFSPAEWPTMEDTSGLGHLSVEELWDRGFTAYGTNNWDDFDVYYGAFLYSPCLSPDAVAEVKSRMSFISFKELEEELGSKVYRLCTGVW